MRGLFTSSRASSSGHDREAPVRQAARAARPASTIRIHPSADLDEGVAVGDGTRVWHLAQIRAGALLGRDVIVGRGAYIGSGVLVGDNCKIQNYALVYEPAVLEAGVFVGPATVLTNDRYPRAVNADGSPKSGDDWSAVGVLVREGAAIGARCVCVAPVTIGRWAVVGAGAVVLEDVPDFALVVGAPARRVRWVGRAGVPLEPVAGSPTTLRCPETGERYEQTGDSELTEVYP